MLNSYKCSNILYAFLKKFVRSVAEPGTTPATSGVVCSISGGLKHQQGACFLRDLKLTFIQFSKFSLKVITYRTSAMKEL